MPSTSEASSPASRIALRRAQVPSARVVLSEPLVYVVSPTPTIAYLSRKYFGVVASTSCRGNGIGVSLLSYARQDGGLRGAQPTLWVTHKADRSPFILPQPVESQRGVVEH